MINTVKDNDKYCKIVLGGVDMLGAIIGDLAGSVYEYGQIKKVTPVKVDKVIEKDAFYSDDTILTIAIADAIMNKQNYGEKLRDYVNVYCNQLPEHKPYFKTMFSPGLTKWAKGNDVGESHGNGAMMRVSPVGYLFNTEEDVIRNAKLVTIPSHNAKEAIDAATKVALIIYYARMGLSKVEITKKLKIDIHKPSITKFNYTCEDTIDVCMYSLFTSDNFVDSIKTAISFGGDTDTNACIVGSMAEAVYGIPENLKKQAFEKLPSNFQNTIKQAYSQLQDITNTLNM